MSKDQFYEVLGMPRQLSIQSSELEQRFHQQTRLWHPDRFARKSVAEQQHALDMSSTLNDAYRTLRDPVKRAEYVLKQEGFDIGEQRSKDVPPELLEEVFELNMALDELNDGDESVRPRIEEAGRNFTHMLTGLDQELQQLFVKHDEQTAPDVLVQIRNLLNRRKYLQNLVDRASGLTRPL